MHGTLFSPLYKKGRMLKRAKDAQQPNTLMKA